MKKLHFHPIRLPAVPEGQFRCAVCEDIFNKEWTDAEALAEMNENFPGLSPVDCVQVCDECYRDLKL
jgi:hypothetical protein